VPHQPPPTEVPLSGAAPVEAESASSTTPVPMPEDDHHIPTPTGEATSRFASMELDAGGGAAADMDAPAADAPAEPVPITITPDGAVILVLGGPGCGKDTQCNKLAETYGCAHLSVVELLRDAVTSATPKGTMISTMIRSGQIVPAQVTLDLLKDAMVSRRGPYLVQGFPKTLDNLGELEWQCGSCAAVVVLDASEEVLAARLVERGKTSHRTDDTPEAIQRRFKTFRLQAEPMLEVLTERGVVHSIDASQPADDVFAKACAVYDQVASG